MGPFDVTIAHIETLGARFTEFVSRLLEVESRAHGLSGHLLTYDIKDTTPDGGVDAATRNAPATDWLPGGDTAWQFKRTDLGPKGSGDEFAGAKWAHDEFLKSGGSYVLVLGKALPDKLIEARRKKIVENAIELGLVA